MDQKYINLFDRFTHGGMNRRDFMEKLTLLAGGTAAATALLPLSRTIMPAPRFCPRAIRALSARPWSSPAAPAIS